MPQTRQGRIVLNRPAPLMPAANYKTYAMRSPVRTHWRPATCEEFECQDYKYGFVTTIDVSTELGQRQHHFLTHDTKRRYHIQRVSLTVFKFVYGPGNICMGYRDHRVPIGRPPKLLVVGGDWRGNPRQEIVRHQRVEHWVEDFSLHTAMLAQKVQRG
jgi:hypothetical protein